MALDLNCRECQAGLSQVGQMAIGFRCFDHGNIGLEISELMKMVKASEALQCCKDVCPNCKAGIPLIEGQFQFHDTHPSDWFCRASATRQRLAGGVS